MSLILSRASVIGMSLRNHVLIWLVVIWDLALMPYVWLHSVPAPLMELNASIGRNVQLIMMSVVHWPWVLRASVSMTQLRKYAEKPHAVTL